MDPISTAIVAALSAGVTGGISKKIISDANESLKALLKQFTVAGVSVSFKKGGSYYANTEVNFPKLFISQKLDMSHSISGFRDKSVA